MKKLNTLVALCGLAVLATSCSSDDSTTPATSRVALKVSSGTISTRATDTSWDANDNIGIVLFNAGTKTVATGSAGQSIYKYVTEKGDGSFYASDEANTAYYPTEEAKVDVAAFYPYSTPDADTKVSINTASQTSLSAIDFMASNKDLSHNSDNPEVALNFRHELTKLNIVIDNSDPTAANVDMTGATVKVCGTATSAKWSVADSTLSDISDIKDITVPATIVDSKLSGTAIILPTAAGKGVEITVATTNGETFHAPLDATTELKASTANTLKVHLSRVECSISTTVTPWTEGVTKDVPVVIAELAGGTADAGNITSANGDEMTIKTALNDGSGYSMISYEYSTANGWTSSYPLYWDDLNYVADKDYAFSIRITPKADGNPEKDYLVGTATAKYGAPLNFTLNHAMAQLKVTLKAGTGYTDDASLMAALSSNVINLKKVLAAGSSSSAIGFTFPLTGYKSITGDASFTSGTTYTVAPQTLTDEAKIVLTLANGNSYILKLSDITVDGNKLSALEAGKTYNITVTVNDTEITTSATLTPWTIISGSGTATPEQDK